MEGRYDGAVTLIRNDDQHYFGEATLWQRTQPGDPPWSGRMVVDRDEMVQMANGDKWVLRVLLGQEAAANVESVTVENDQVLVDVTGLGPLPF